MEELSSELLECARYGEIEELAAIIDSKEVPIDHKDIGGNTALHKACANGHVDCVAALLKGGALSTGNESGNTPLHWAAANGHLKVRLHLPVDLARLLASS